MNKNPFFNAVLAAGYIVFVAFIMSSFADGPKEGEGQAIILIPIVVLSLFTLSAAVMGYLFLSQPTMLYLENKKQEAVNFFLTTVGVFAVITIALLASLFFVI